MCRTELGEEATKKRVKTDTAEPLLLSDMKNKELPAVAPDVVKQTRKLFGANFGDRTEVERREVGDDIELRHTLGTTRGAAEPRGPEEIR